MKIMVQWEIHRGLSVLWSVGLVALVPCHQVARAA